MAEQFENDVQIAEVITDEKNINKEALEHIESMGKGEEE